MKGGGVTLFIGGRLRQGNIMRAIQCQTAKAEQNLAGNEGLRVIDQRSAARISSSSTAQGSVFPAKVSGSLLLLCLG